MSDMKDQLKMDAADLFREETFTDQKTGAIRRLTPVDENGDARTDVKTLYFGQTQIVGPAGPMPINFELDVENLQQAAEQFADNAEQEIERTIKELQELQRQQQSSIMVPGQGGPAAPSGIQMP